MKNVNDDLEDRAALVEIARRAIEADKAERTAKLIRSLYLDACNEFRNGRSYIKSGTPEHDAMLEYTASEYADSQKAKRQAYNAKRRLQAAIAKGRDEDEIDRQNTMRLVAIDGYYDELCGWSEL